jgi:Gti1/Pac2 family
MQRPTCTDIRVRSVSDALVIFYAVSKGVLPIVSRRLDSEERRCIRSGSVYVWEERGPDAEATGVSFFSFFHNWCHIPVFSSESNDGQMVYAGALPVSGTWDLCHSNQSVRHL